MNSSNRTTEPALSPTKRLLAIIVTVALVGSMVGISTFAQALNDGTEETPEMVQEAEAAESVVQLGLQNAYIVVDDQNVSADLQKKSGSEMTVPTGQELVFSAFADDGFTLEEVTASDAATGAEIPIGTKIDDESKLVIAREYVTDGLMVTVKAVEVAVPEAGPTAEEPAAVEDSEAAEAPDGGNTPASTDKEAQDGEDPNAGSESSSDEQPADVPEAAEGDTADIEAPDSGTTDEAEPAQDSVGVAKSTLQQQLTGSFAALVSGSGLGDGVSLMGDGKEYFTLELTYDAAGKYGDGNELSEFWNGYFDHDVSGVKVAQQVKWDYTGYAYEDQRFEPGTVSFKVPKLIGGLEVNLPEIEQKGGLKLVADKDGYLEFTNINTIGPGSFGYFTIEYSFDTNSDLIQALTDPAARTNPITGEENVPDMYFITDTHATVSFTNDAGEKLSTQSNDAPFALTLLKDEYQITKTISGAKSIPGDLPTSFSPTAEDLENYYYIPYVINWNQASGELKHSLHTPGITLTDRLPDIEGIELLGAAIGMGGSYNAGTQLYFNGQNTSDAAKWNFSYNKADRTLTWTLTQRNMDGGATGLTAWVRIPKKAVDALANKEITNFAEGNGAYNNNPDEPAIHDEDDVTVDASKYGYDGSGNNGLDGASYFIDKTMVRTSDHTLYAGNLWSQNDLAAASDTFASTVWVTKSLVSGAGKGVDVTIVDEFMDVAQRANGGSTRIEQQANTDFYYQNFSVIGNPSKIGGKDYEIWVQHAGGSFVLADSGTLSTTAGSNGDLASWSTDDTDIVAAKIVVKDVTATLSAKELGLYMTGTVVKNSKYLDDDDAMLINSAYMEVNYHDGGATALKSATTGDYKSGTDTLYATPYNSNETIYRTSWEAFAAARDQRVYDEYKWRTADRINLVNRMVSVGAWKGVQSYGSQWKYNVNEGCFELAYYVQMHVQVDSMRVNNFTMVDILPKYVTIDPDSVSVVYYNKLDGGGSPKAYDTSGNHKLPTVNKKAAVDNKGLYVIPLTAKSATYDGDYEYLPDYQGQGSDAIRVKFESDVSDASAGLFPGDYVELRFTARCYDYIDALDGNAFGSLRNHSTIVLNDFEADDTSTSLLITSTNKSTDDSVTVTDIDKSTQTYSDLDGNGTTNENVLVNFTDQSMDRNFSAGQNGIVKLVTTDKNPIATKKATATLGSAYQYILNINAQGGDLRNIVIYDTLPHAGDTFYKPDANGNVQRGSEWAPTLLGVKLGNVADFFTGSKVYYSTKYNPGTLTEAPGDWFAADEYAATHDNLYDVKTFCVDLGEGTLPEGKTVILTVDAQASANEADIDTIAVNTFHYTSEIKKVSDIDFMPQGVLETNKVDVTIKAGEMILGDTVFFDKNNDGIQGSDEPGIPNALVHLYIVDENGDVTHDGLKLREVDSVYTDENGKYVFIPKEEGTYVVKVDEPEGYKGFSDPVFTDADNGGDETLQLNKADKGGWLKPIAMDKGANNRNMHQDAGLIPGSTPPEPVDPTVDKTINEQKDLVSLANRDDAFTYELTYDFTGVDTSGYSAVSFVDDLSKVFDKTGTVSSDKVIGFDFAGAKIYRNGTSDDVTGTLGSFDSATTMSKLVYNVSDDQAKAMGGNIYTLVVTAHVLGTATDADLAYFSGDIRENAIPNEAELNYLDFGNEGYLKTEPVYVIPPDDDNPPLSHEDGILRVTKTLEDTSGLVPADKTYTFVITDASGTPLAGKGYTLGDGTTDQTDADGSFTLKAGQTALFLGLPVDDGAGNKYSYRVEEINLDAAAVEGTTLDVIHKVDFASDLGAKTKDFGLVSEAMVTVEFINTYKEVPPLGNEDGILRVTKAVEDATGLVPADKAYTFVITDASGTPLAAAPYTLGDGTAATTGSDGSFTLKAGQTALFLKLSAGDYYGVYEADSSRTVSGADLTIKTVVSINATNAAEALGTAVEVDDVGEGKLVAFTNSYSKPAIPDNPSNPSGSNSGKGSPTTGDPLLDIMILLGSLTVLSGVGLAIGSRRRKGGKAA